MYDLGADGGKSIMPVVGPCEAALHSAAMVGRRFGMVCYTADVKPALRRLIRSYGMEQFVVAFETIGIGLTELGPSGPTVRDRLIATVTRMVDEHDVDVMGVSMCPVIVSRAELEEAVGVPVVDGISAPIEMAACLLRLGLHPSERQWPRGSPVADIAAGSYLVQGVLTSLLERERTGAGTVLQVSLFDAMVEWMGYPIYYTLFGGTPPERVGLAHPTVVPYDAYPTADGQRVIIAVQNDAGWRALATHVLDRSDLITDPRFATNVARTENRAAVDRVVADRTVQLTAAELLEALKRAGVACGQVRDMAEVIEHPQLTSRDRWDTVDSPVGPIRVVLPPLAASKGSVRMDPIPAFGEHSDAILAELGYGEADRDRLRATGAVA